jgi:uncharacterized membrane protein
MEKRKRENKVGGHLAPDAPPEQRRLHWQGAALAAILILAAGLRLYAVQTANLWHDEFWTLELSCGRDTAHEHLPTDVLLPSLASLTSPAEALPWWRLPGSLSQVTHPPLFFWLLRFWRDLLGSSDSAARLLPCIASVAAVALLYRVVGRLSGPGAALWAALLMALSGQQIFYAQEVRSYSLIVMLGLAALAVLIEIEKPGVTCSVSMLSRGTGERRDKAGVTRFRVLGFGALVLALLLTHYFTIGLVLGLAVYAALRLPRRVVAQLAAALGAAGLIFLLAWGPFMLRQRQAMGLENEGGAAFLLERGPLHAWHTLERLIAVPAQSLAPATFMNAASLPPLVAWVALPAFLVPLAWLRRRGDLLVWYLSVAGVLLPLLILDLSRSSMHLAFPRYTLLAGPGVFAVIGAGSARMTGLWKHAVPAIAVAACAVLLPASLREPASKKDWQPIASLAAASMQPGDPLLVTAPPDRAPQVYLYVSHYLGPMNRPVAIITRPISPQLESQLRSHPRVWVINAWAQLPPLFGGAPFHIIASTEMADFGQIQWPR